MTEFTSNNFVSKPANDILENSEKINQTFKELSKKIKDKNLKDSVPLGVKNGF